MSEDIDGGVEPAAPIWPVFGDLMSVLLGAFVLILVGVIGVQLELSSKLEQEVKQRQAETQRRKTLEQALAGPLAAGRVTLVNGRIGISGSVLFALNSDQLQPRRPGSAEEPGRAAVRVSAGQRRNPDGERLHRRPARARRQSPFRRQLGAVGAARVDGDARADRRGRAGVVGVRRRVRLRAAGELERRRAGAGEKPSRGNGAGAEAVDCNGEAR